MNAADGERARYTHADVAEWMKNHVCVPLSGLPRQKDEEENKKEEGKC